MVQHKTQTVAHAQVSSIDQSLDRQLEAVGDVDRAFEEKVSGGPHIGRAALFDCIGYVRNGDTVRVASMDRLARLRGHPARRALSLFYIEGHQAPMP